MKHYFFDKKIFWSVILILLVWGVAAFVENDFSFKNRYVVCCPASEPLPCHNPFISDFSGFCSVKDPVVCSQEFISPGSCLGEEPGFFTRSFGAATIFFLIAAFVINHVIHNRRQES